LIAVLQAELRGFICLDIAEAVQNSAHHLQERRADFHSSPSLDRALMDAQSGCYFAGIQMNWLE
jgi:hypothetical protein